MTRDELAQAMYESVWPNSRLEDSLPEVRENFRRMADTAAHTLNITLENR